jgi:pimeloyl-ACP methyl ester carboxylesterase
LPTQDGAVVSGFWFRNGDEATVVVLAHPREHLVSHYLVPEILEGGAAVWCQAPRLVGNDIKLEHETALFDLAAGLAFLRKQGYRHIVVLGNSGGAPLWALYNQQATLAPEARITHTPAGRPVNLRDADLPVPDGVILVSPHKGQGALLLDGIDPSVVDEDRPLDTDPALDPFSPANGFAPPPASSTYAPAFVERYRQAQRARVERIDRKAREIVHARAAARAALKTGDAGAAAVAAHTPVLTIWRTDADLRCFDQALDPSDRNYGSLWGRNPYTSNLGSIGFGRLCTAESWLSTWSALSTNASMERCAPAITQPTLVVQYTGDNSVFPSDADRIYDWIGSADKRRVKFAGDHHGRAVHGGSAEPQLQAGRAIREWLRERFPQH